MGRIIRLLQGYKTYIMAIGIVATAIYQYLTGTLGDMDVLGWILGGGGLAALGAKLNRGAQNEVVEDITSVGNPDSN